MGIGQLAGAAIGSCICPGVGTAIGGAVGGIAEEAITQKDDPKGNAQQGNNAKQAGGNNIMELLEKLLTALTQGKGQQATPQASQFSTMC